MDKFYTGSENQYDTVFLSLRGCSLRYGEGAVPIGFPCRCRGIPCMVVKDLSRLDFSANVRLFFIYVRVCLCLEVHMNRREFLILLWYLFCSFPCRNKKFSYCNLLFSCAGVFQWDRYPNWKSLWLFVGWWMLLFCCILTKGLYPCKGRGAPEGGQPYWGW